MSMLANVLPQRDLPCHVFQLVLAVTKAAVCETVWHSWGKAREQAISSKINCNLLLLNWPKVHPVQALAYDRLLIIWSNGLFLVKPQFPLGLCLSVPALCNLQTGTLFKGEVSAGSGNPQGAPAECLALGSLSIGIISFSGPQPPLKARNDLWFLRRKPELREVE